MIDLLKFEFLRKKSLFQIAISMIVLSQVFLLFRFYCTNKAFRVDYFEGFVMLYLIILLIVFIILYLVDIITLFRNDIYHSEGYMLFLTPNSGYKILASKLCFAIIEGIAVAIIFSLVFVLNARVLYGASFFKDLIQIEADWNIISLILKTGMSVVISLVSFALTIYLSFAIYKSLFPNFRFKGLLTFAIFIGISVFKGRVVAYISMFQIKNTYSLLIEKDSLTKTLEMIAEAVSVNLAINIVGSIIAFFITGYLLEKKINL